MEFTGRIIFVGEKQSGDTERGHWERQSFTLEYFADPRDRYSKCMAFSVFGADRLAKFNIQKDKEYVVSFDIDAREYKGAWYNDIQAWNVVPVNADVNTSGTVAQDNASSLI